MIIRSRATSRIFTAIFEEKKTVDFCSRTTSDGTNEISKPYVFSTIYTNMSGELDANAHIDSIDDFSLNLHGFTWH